MKVAVTLALDVDPKAWAAAHRSTADPQAVREAVKFHLLDAARRTDGVIFARLGVPSARVMPSS